MIGRKGFLDQCEKVQNQIRLLQERYGPLKHVSRLRIEVFEEMQRELKEIEQVMRQWQQQKGH